MTESLLCAACKSPVHADATKCPSCAANLDMASVKSRARLSLIVIGVALTFTILGAIIGIPMIVIGAIGHITVKAPTVLA